MSEIVLTAASRVGCVRSNNEDMVLAYDKFVRSEAYHTTLIAENVDRFVIALADGMGGGLSISEFNEMMVVWMESVNQMITSKGHADPSMEEMGTTLVGIIYYGGRYYWINCGDSRLYRLRDGKLKQISTDHSLSNLYGEKRHSNVITNCIGAGCKNSFLDIYEFTDDFLSGDLYLLCSDGLNDMVPDEEIERLLVDGASANRLCEAAIEAGGYDNVSTCVISVK